MPIQTSAETSRKDFLFFKNPEEIVFDLTENTRTSPDSYNSDALLSLAGNIRKIGQLEPAGVVRDGDKYRLAFGYRRLKAVLLWNETYPNDRLPFKAIPTKISGREAFLANVSENSQRKNYTPLEEARILRRMTEEFGMTQKECQAIFGYKVQASVSQRLSLLTLDDATQAMLDKGELKFSHALELTRVTKEKRAEIIESCKNASASTKQEEKEETNEVTAAEVKPKKESKPRVNIKDVKAAIRKVKRDKGEIVAPSKDEVKDFIMDADLRWYEKYAPKTGLTFQALQQLWTGQIDENECNSLIMAAHGEGNRV